MAQAGILSAILIILATGNFPITSKYPKGNFLLNVGIVFDIDSENITEKKLQRKCQESSKDFSPV